MKPFLSNLPRQFRYSIKYIVAVLVFAVSIGFVGEHSITERIKRKHEIVELQEKIAEQERIFAQDKEALEELKTDKEAVRKVAREKYYMKKENEDIFIIED